MKRLALAAIGFYQRVISPRKGFCCAYRTCTGHASCSALGYRAIRRHGVWAGLAILRLRLDACGDAYQDLLRSGQVRPAARPLQSQAGSCDCALPCDFDANACNTAGDCFSNVSDCDWPDFKRKRRARSEDADANQRRRRRRQRGEG